MNQLPKENGKITVFIKGKHPGVKQYYAALAGLNIENGTVDFISAVAARSSEELRLTHPGKNPERLRQKIINNKIAIRDKQDGYLIREADELFHKFFENHATELSELLTSGKREEATRFIEKNLRRIIENPGASFETYYLRGISEKPDSPPATRPSRGGSNRRRASTANSNKITLPVSPLIGVGNGIKAREISRSDKILVKFTPQALQKLEGKINGSTSREELTRSRPATVLEYRSTYEGMGQLLVEIDNKFNGSCIIPEGSLLKPAEGRIRSTGRSHGSNVPLIIWFTLLIITAVIILVVFL